MIKLKLYEIYIILKNTINFFILNLPFRNIFWKIMNSIIFTEFSLNLLLL